MMNLSLQVTRNVELHRVLFGLCTLMSRLYAIHINEEEQTHSVIHRQAARQTMRDNQTGCGAIELYRLSILPACAIPLHGGTCVH